MGIEINGKKYKFNPDVRLGILDMMERGDVKTIKKLKMVLKELLMPNPSPKELFNIRQKDSEKIFIAYGEYIGEELVETKKKLSS